VAVRCRSTWLKAIFGFLGTNGAGKIATISMLRTPLNPSCGSAIGPALTYGYIAGLNAVTEPVKDAAELLD
jgi:ABC-type Na+ transport system ATPase subunit NatA